MESNEIRDFQGTQQDLLAIIKTSHVNDYTGLQQNCSYFLKNQRKQLQILEQKRRIHMNEKGKVMFRLVAEEQVTLSDLKDLYQVFAKLLEEFILRMATLERLPNPQIASIFLALKKEAIIMMMEMLERSPVLEVQPDNVNYDTSQHQIPTLLFLGAQCLSDSDFSIVDCRVDVVSDSDLHNASNANISLETVKGLEGVEVSPPKKQKDAKSSSSIEKPKAVAKDLGVWSIPKKKLSISDKGSAHKDWVRLKYTMKVQYRGVTKKCMLLSLPFNIRKGSVQMYTFIGALMWYFYVTEDPYKAFRVSSHLPTSIFLNMLVARLEVIGRKLSPEAKAFFNELLLKLSSERTAEPRIELDTVTRGPPSKQVPEPREKTRTVSETIDIYGFFTWFYALVNSLDTSGYLHDLWLDGYIYDIYGPERTKEMIMDDKFGNQVVVIRPSMSTVHNHQGKNIHMCFALHFKTITPKGERYKSLSLMKDDLLKCGLHVCLTERLPIVFVYKSDRMYRSVEDLKDATPEKFYNYHSTKFKKSKGPTLVGSGAPKHCSTCRCHNAEVNSLPDEETAVKKVRIPSGNSDHFPPSSDMPSENLFHKHNNSPQSVCSPVGNQVTSPACNAYYNTMGSIDFCFIPGPADSDTDAETCMSPDSSTVPDFNKIMSPDQGNSPWRETSPTNKSFTLPSTTNRNVLMANLCKAVVSCTNEQIEKLTEDLQRFTAGMESPNFSMASSPEQVTHFVDFQRGESYNNLHSHDNDTNFLDEVDVSEMLEIINGGNDSLNHFQQL